MTEAFRRTIRKTARALAALPLLALLWQAAPAAAVPPQDPVEDSTQVHTGVFRAGEGDSRTLMRLEWTPFLAAWQSLEKSGYRMVDFETYTEGSKRLYAGVFRPGTDARGAFIGKEWDEFHARWQELEGKNLRMVDIEVYEAGGKTLFAGIFHPGRDGKGALVGLEWGEFVKQSSGLEKQGLRMIDYETYTAGGKRLHAAVFRAGAGGHAMWAGVDEENFTSQMHSLGKKSLALTDIEIYASPWPASCLNQVMPEEGGNYTRNITSTPLHCEGQPGSCGTPGPAATVLYSSPWYEEADKKRYARISALYPDDKFLTLPFDDADVKPSGLWRYGSNTYHHAGDYSQGESTFQLRASAPGRVIHIGWDSWGGGTLIVSHDVGGDKDNYRTIFRHVRNGADNDCESAWKVSVPTLKGDTLKEYKDYLLMSGCAEKKADRKLQEKYWGKNSEAIDMSLLGKSVARGQALAWTGNTGPGGKKGTGAASNTHLHIFWARRDPSDMKWYFFDPYGIYAAPACYPAGVTDAVTGTHARYPVAWKDGKPQYPGK